MRHYRVITVGESTVDAFMTLHPGSHKVHLDQENGNLAFQHGGKIDVDRYDFCLGGNATNVAVGLNRLGISATICSQIGDDEFSFIIRNNLAKEHVDRLFITQTKDSPTNFSVIINYKNDRTVFTQNIERAHEFQLEDVTAEWFYVTSLAKEWEQPYKYVLNFAKENNVKIAFNPGTRQLRSGRETVEQLLRHTEILFLNKEEAQRLLFDESYENDSNEHDYVKEILAKLQKLGPKTIVLTNGFHGSFVLDADGNYHYQSLLPGKVVERTGAGDSYSTGFLGAVIHRKSIEDAMTWGSANAASVIEHIGAQTGLLTREEMEKRTA